MADTIREQIIQNIVSEIGSLAITVGDSETYPDITVLRATKNPVEDELPAYVVWPGVEEVDQVFGVSNCTMPIEIEGLISIAGENVSAYEEALLGGIIKDMAGSAVGTLTNSVRYTGGGPKDHGDPENTIAAVGATFEIEYSTNLGDPYNQTSI